MGNTAKPKVILRPPEVHRDLDRIFRWELTQRRGYDVPDDAPPAPSRMQLWMFLSDYRHSLALDGQLRYMVDTEDDDEDVVTVGCVDLADYDAISQTAFVSIFTAVPLRNRGYARAALEELIIEAKGMGIKILVARVSQINDASKALFAAAGFKTDNGEKYTLEL